MKTFLGVVPESRISAARRWPWARGESGIGQERLLLAGDQGRGLTLRADGEGEIDDLEVEGAHGALFMGVGVRGGGVSAWR